MQNEQKKPLEKPWDASSYNMKIKFHNRVKDKNELKIEKNMKSETSINRVRRSSYFFTRRLTLKFLKKRIYWKKTLKKIYPAKNESISALRLLKNGIIIQSHVDFACVSVGRTHRAENVDRAHKQLWNRVSAGDCSVLIGGGMFHHTSDNRRTFRPYVRWDGLLVPSGTLTLYRKNCRCTIEQCVLQTCWYCKLLKL